MIIELFLFAVRKMRNNRCSINLAMIGIAVSTFVILMVFTLSNASKNMLISYLTYKYPVLNTLTCRIEGGEEYAIETDEIIHIDNLSLTYVENVVYQTDFFMGCSVKDNHRVQVVGAYNKPVSIKIVEGRFLYTQESVSDNCFNIVISDGLAKKIFKNEESALNKTIEIRMDNNCTYQLNVIGIYENLYESSEMQVIYGSFDTVSVISGDIKPYKILGFSVNVSDISKVEDVKSYISTFLNNRYRNSSEYKYNIMVCDVLKSSNVLINLLSTVLIIFSGIMFVVSGISIRNVILTIMQSYVHQIGIKKAIGASENIICLEYLIPGIIITLAGSAVGFASSMLAIYILNSRMDSILAFIGENYDVPFVYSMNLKLYLSGTQSVVTFLFALVIVIICCYTPVKKMANMSVVDALRK